MSDLFIDNRGVLNSPHMEMRPRLSISGEEMIHGEKPS